MLHKLRPGRQKVELKPKQAKPFYLSNEWRSLISMIKKQRGNQCHDPDHPHDVPRWKGRIYGDHVIELADGGAALDPRNIVLRCHLCHQRKTVRHRIARFHGDRGVD
jgi:hypothetical protein